MAERPFRELSGVAWDPVLQLAIGVRDERLDYPGYEIFAFDPNTVGDDGCHRALPLLSDSLSRVFQLDDLEGITRLPTGEFFALHLYRSITSHPSATGGVAFKECVSPC